MRGKLLAVLLMFWAGTLSAQGFAGLGQEAGDQFATPRAGQALVFPGDHGAHPNFRIEWWYLTSNLKGDDGRDYGVQWTLFRSASAPREGEPWDSPQNWMGHAGVTTPDDHFFAERLARGGTGQAGVRAAPFEAWIDDWQMIGQPSRGDALDRLKVTARGAQFAYALSLEANGPLVFQGDNGFSVKSAEGQASYYYSQPFYSVEGTLSLPGGDVEVAGQAWLDREYSSQPLSEDQTGWDWFSLHLDDGAKLMGFGLRGSGATYTSATWITPEGETVAYPDGALRLTPQQTQLVAGREIPVQWRVELPAQGLSVLTRPLNPKSWMQTLFPYWEGPITFEGTHGGRGYLEMTGYAPALEQ